MRIKSTYFLVSIFIFYAIILLYPKAVFAADVTLAWDAPIDNEDGTPLTDLAGFNVYYGTQSRGGAVYPSEFSYDSVENAGNATSYQVMNLTDGLTYYFAITAFNASGIESIFSSELSITLSSPFPVPDIVVSDSVSPAGDQQIPFGDITEGSVSQQNITITNNGNADLVIANIAQSNPISLPFSILNDYCSSQTISPSSNCTLTVNFSPSSSGSFNDSFDIPSDDPDESSLTFNLTGNGLAVPIADITVTDSVPPAGNLQIPFGDVTEGSVSQQNITITNSGNADLVIGAIAQNNSISLPFSVQSDYCSAQTISPSSNCTLTVNFSPSSSGSFNDSFDIPSDDPDESSLTFNLSGNGLAVPIADITVTDSVAPTGNLQIPFGDVTESNTSQQNITITNNGNADLLIGNIAQSNPIALPFSLQSDYCSAQTISPSSNCTLTVNFSPSSSGSFNDSFDISSDDPDESYLTFNVSGNGLAVPIADITVTDSVAPAGNLQIPFGDVTNGSVSQQNITITNNGNADLLIGNIAQSNPIALPFSLQSDYCSAQTISPASNCTLTVNFSPSSSGSFNDSFDIPSDDPDESSLTFNLSGNGLAVPIADITVTDSVTPSSDLQVPFGDVTEGLSTDHTVTIQNNGSANLVTGNIASNNPLSAPFSILNNTCSGLSIPPSSNCTLTVRFAPSSTGSFNDSFDIPSNDPDENPAIVSISGIGLSSIVNNPPDDPALVYPADGQRGLGMTVGFIWEKSTDPDGDLVTYDLQVCQDQSMTAGCMNEVNIALLEIENIYYAGTGSFGAGFACLLIGPALIGAIRRLNRKAFLKIGIVLIAGMLVVSCGGGGSGGVSGAVISSEYGSSDDPGSEISYSLDLEAGTTYYWKVVAKDGNGGEASSEVRSFETL